MNRRLPCVLVTTSCLLAVATSVLMGCGTGIGSLHPYQQYIDTTKHSYVTGTVDGDTNWSNARGAGPREEFWQFEAQYLVQDNFGISHGYTWQDLNVIGPPERCEAFRAEMNSNIPTRPCKGPRYFRRAR